MVQGVIDVFSLLGPPVGWRRNLSESHHSK